MNWYYFAEKDWEIYQDAVRTRNFVVMGKISETDYKAITGIAY